MTLTTSRSTVPAVLGGEPAFPGALPLTRVQLPDQDDIRRRLETILASGQLTNGRTVRELEVTAAEQLQVPHVVAVSSCTAGLLLVLQAVGATGRVVLPSFTFAATAHAVIWNAGTPIWADVDRTSLTLDPDDAEAALDGATALMATHVYGTPCSVERLDRLAKTAGIPLVYDAAHALGSRHAGRPIGSFGTAEVFSLSPTKVVTGAEGGLVGTRDEGLAATLRLARDYGNPGDYNCLFPGLNARMSELHAAVALTSLAAVEQRVAHRTEMARRFRGATSGLPGLRFPVVDAGNTSTYKDLTVIVDDVKFGLDAEGLARALRAEGIDSRRYFYPPVHRQKAYVTVPQRPLPVTDAIAQQVLTVPLWSHMTQDVVDRVADTVVRIQQHAAEIAITFDDEDGSAHRA